MYGVPVYVCCSLKRIVNTICASVASNFIRKSRSIYVCASCEQDSTVHMLKCFSIRETSSPSPVTEVSPLDHIEELPSPRPTTIEPSKSLSNLLWPYENSWLRRACWVRWLYSAWLSINLQDDYTALHLAVQYGKHLAAQMLLGYGADVNITGGPVRIHSISFHWQEPQRTCPRAVAFHATQEVKWASYSNNSVAVNCKKIVEIGRHVSHLGISSRMAFQGYTSGRLRANQN